MKTVFIPPIVNWGFLRQLPQQIASQFAKNGYRVMFCNERLVGADIKKVEVEKNLFVYPNYEYAKHEIDTLNIKIDILYNTAAKNYPYVDDLKPKYTIYHSCDSFEEWKPLENDILKRADIVLCTSDFIYDMRIKQHNNVHLVKNGCNENIINKSYEKIENFKFIKRPICVFSGACGVWVSTYLIRNVAKEYCTYFIGQSFGKKIPDNLTIIPTLEHSSMIEILKNMDIGLLPFNVKSEITQAANPIKLWEYLACGLPVVSTSWIETDREELKEVVFTSKNDEEYIANVNKIVSMDETERLELKNKCLEVAKNNTWEKRFKTIDTEIKKFFN